MLSKTGAAPISGFGVSINRFLVISLRSVIVFPVVLSISSNCVTPSNLKKIIEGLFSIVYASGSQLLPRAIIHYAKFQPNFHVFAFSYHFYNQVKKEK